MSSKEKEKEELSMKESVKRRVRKEEHAFRIVEKMVLIDSVEREFLIDAGEFITISHYNDIIEERAITKLCGYPLCSHRLTKVLKQKYKISLKEKTVYDITERKNFCSNTCYKGSKYFESQLLAEPVWLRDDQPDLEIKLLEDEKDLKKQVSGSGEEIIINKNIEKFSKEKAESQKHVAGSNEDIGYDYCGYHNQDINEVSSGVGDVCIDDDVIDHDDDINIGDDVIDHDDDINIGDDVIDHNDDVCIDDDDVIDTDDDIDIDDDDIIDTDDDINIGDDVINDDDVIDDDNIDDEISQRNNDVRIRSEFDQLGDINIDDDVIDNDDDINIDDVSSNLTDDLCGNHDDDYIDSDDDDGDNIDHRIHVKKDTTSKYNDLKSPQTNSESILQKFNKLPILSKSQENDSVNETARTRDPVDNIKTNFEIGSGDQNERHVFHENTKDKRKCHVENVYKILCEWCSSDTLGYCRRDKREIDKGSDEQLLKVEQIVKKTLPVKQNFSIPSIDSKNPIKIRGKIVSERLTKALYPMVSRLGLALHDMSSEMTKILKTFRFNSTNIVLKPLEWTLVGLVVIYTFKNSDPLLQTLLNSQQTILDSLLNDADVTEQELERLVAVFTREKMTSSMTPNPRDFNMEELD